VNTVSFYIPPGWQLHSKWLFTAHRQHGLEASQCGSIGCDVIKRMVRVTRDPEPVEKDSKFSSDRNDCPFLAVSPAPLEHSRAPAFKITVRAKTSQQILSALNEQRSELFVASLADSELLFD
jgi:hypothetical protein